MDKTAHPHTHTLHYIVITVLYVTDSQRPKYCYDLRNILFVMYRLIRTHEHTRKHMRKAYQQRIYRNIHKIDPNNHIIWLHPMLSRLYTPIITANTHKTTKTTHIFEQNAILKHADSFLHLTHILQVNQSTLVATFFGCSALEKLWFLANPTTHLQCHGNKTSSNAA